MENKKEKRNLSIHYNTNLSKKYDEESLIDLWRGFSRVYLSRISCDGIGKVGEYQRTEHPRYKKI